uniref:C2H2-type domain-containing protein n=1 Tax=Homalodisca liturata TaxID=320908 RepID=A0A1B6JCR0_9HEMI
MSDSNPIIALNDFKKQLDTLSQSLDHFDPEERSKALDLLQECIQGLESKESFSLAEDLFGEVNSTVSDLNVSKNSEVSSMEDYRGELSTSDEKVEEEELEYNAQSEEECESQSEEDWKSVLKCPKCGDEHESKLDFLAHLQTHSGKSKPCVDCHKVFQNSITFKVHKQLQMCSSTSKMYKCKLCNKTLYAGSQYSAHLSAHKRNQCKTCGDHFAKRKHLQAHAMNVHNVSLNKDMFRCDVCERTFSQRRSLAYHYQIAHPDTTVCTVCLEIFGSQEELQDHQTIHKQQQLISCDQCDQQFSRRQQYLAHLKEHEKYKCLNCNESFSAKKRAEKHAREGHEVSGLELQLQCAQCGQMFCSQKLLKSHTEQYHSGSKSLTCDKCKRTFKHERYFKSHLETEEHLRGEEPKAILVCKECKKTFTNKSNLRIHISRMHRADLKEHACTLCPYKTKVQTNLKRHLAFHLEKPQFICDKCGAQMQSKNALHEHHQLVHNENKYFSCEKCGKLFSRSSDLKRHLSNTHSDTPLYACHCGSNYTTLSNLRRHQLLSHGEVDIKQKRLKKLFPSENKDPPKKKVKKEKVKKESVSSKSEELLIKPDMSDISPDIPETNTVVMMGDQHPEELLQVAYNMDFASDDKSHVVYAQNLDMSNLHVVESMIHLDGDPDKQGASVLINVRNVFANDYMIPASMETSIVNPLGDTLADTTHHIAVSHHKADVMSGLQDYIIPNDLNFL